MAAEKFSRIFHEELIMFARNSNRCTSSRSAAVPDAGMRIAPPAEIRDIDWISEESMMLNLKLLVGSSAVAAGVWKVWTSPGPLSLVLHVLCALIVSWAIFVAVLYLTAAHLRRTPMRNEIPRPMTPAARLTREYVAQFKRQGH